MTELEWLLSTESRPMLEFLRGKASERKLRLFAVACCYHVWAWLADQRSRQAVSIAEAYADGLVCTFKLNQVFVNALAAIPIGRDVGICDFYFPHAAAYVAYSDDWLSAHIAVESVANAKVHEESHRKWRLRTLHDIFGNPFRPIDLDPSWLTWHDGLLVSMAQRMYDSRDFFDMPILADALEEAGCTNQDIMNHCRESGVHVRGCWPVDLCLGKS